MDSWIQLLSDDGKIKAMFGDEIPSLSRVDLHEVSGGSLTLDGNLGWISDELPDERVRYGSRQRHWP